MGYSSVSSNYEPNVIEAPSLGVSLLVNFIGDVIGFEGSSYSSSGGFGLVGDWVLVGD